MDFDRLSNDFSFNDVALMSPEKRFIYNNLIQSSFNLISSIKSNSKICKQTKVEISAQMAEKEILSIKIVSVDHYSCYPIQSLDVTHSESRGSAVKQVPVIRIFGITQNKKKICAK